MKKVTLSILAIALLSANLANATKVVRNGSGRYQKTLACEVNYKYEGKQKSECVDSYSTLASKIEVYRLNNKAKLKSEYTDGNTDESEAVVNTEKAGAIEYIIQNKDTSVVFPVPAGTRPTKIFDAFLGRVLI